MSSGLYTHTTRATGTILTAAIYNADHQNHVTNQTPQMTGAASDNVAQMQVTEDPGGVGSESLAGSLYNELTRLRFAIKRIIGGAQWYSTPAFTLNNVFAGAVALSSVLSPAALAADQNDYAPAGIATAAVVRLNVTADCAVTGILAGTSGQIYNLVNVGTNRVTLKNNNAGSAAANRFQFGYDVALDTDGDIYIQYDATTARWRKYAVMAAVAIGPPPMGVLTATSGQPVMTAGYGTGETNVAATNLFYTPDVGGYAPFVGSDGGIIWLPFTELTMALNNPNHLANTVYDLFLYLSAGRPAIASGPSWDTAGNYVSAGALTTGAAARGVGAGKTQLTRLANGFQVNTVAMTARNGASGAIAIAAGAGIYVGSFWTDATAGAVTMQMLIGQNRKWGLYNAYGRRDRSLLVGDSTAGWSGTSTIRALRGQTANSGSILSGFSEEVARARTMFTYNCAVNGNQAFSAVGIASITVMSGFRGTAGVASGTPSPIGSATGEHRLTPFLGCQSFTHMEQADNGTVSALAAPSGNQMVVDFKA